MVEKIKGIKVVGTVTQDGRCPDSKCKQPIIVRDEGYRFIKDRGTVEFDNGERYIKCKHCGQFVMRPQIAV